jgi:flagellar hook-basal body complex protein FliE
MTIAPIPAISSAALTQRLSPTAGSAPSAASTASGFAGAVNKALDTVAGQQASADALAEQAATGALRDPAEYMIAATEASLSTELTVAVRNKAVEAFNDIMRMTI